MHRTQVLSALSLVVCAGSVSRAGLTFDFTDGPGLSALDGTDPVRAAGIRSAAAAAGARWSAIWGDDVTLHITLDYDAAFPTLAGSYATFDPSGTPYAAVKGAMVADATSPFDAVATGHLQPGPSLKVGRNSVISPFTIELDDNHTINNEFMDLTSSNKKALGMIPGHSGGAGSDGTIKFGDFAFDFDPSDGITGGTFDLTGVVLHELSHNMGFISGVDTMSVLFGDAPFSVMDPDPVVTVTTLDLFRYTSDSMALGPLIPDVSLHTPSGSPVRKFSIDGGMTAIDEFSWGTALAGDTQQAGHWKSDATFGLMDPSLTAGFDLTDWFDTHVGAPIPDTIALDVIGWTRVPAPGALAAFGVVGVMGAQRRRS